jgi:hypothetical protein
VNVRKKMGNIKIVKLKEDRNDDLLMELNKDYSLQDHKKRA